MPETGVGLGKGDLIASDDSQNLPDLTLDSGSVGVLLVEDNEADAALVQENLNDVAGVQYELHRAKTLNGAKNELATHRCDIMLLDLFLPDSQGLETFERVMRWSHSAAVVILSSLDDEALAFKAMQQGAHYYLLKSELTGNMLSRTVRYALERHRIENALAARERRWRAMLEHSSDVVSLFDKNLNLLYASESVEQLTGFKPQELIGGLVWERIHPDDREGAIRGFANAVANDGMVRTTFRFQTSAGSWLWFDAVATNALDDPAVQAVVVKSRDVTERVRAEQATERQKALLQATVESLPGIFYLADDTPHLHMWNKNLEDVTGLSGDELEAMNPMDLFEEEHIGDVFGRAFNEGKASTEASILTKEGAVPHYFTAQCFELDGETLMAGLALDMSEQKTVERQLQFQASLLSQVQNAVIATDATGSITYLNDFAEQLYGWTQEEAIGLPVSDVNVPLGATKRAEEILGHVAQTGRWAGEFELRRKDGSTFPAWTTLSQARTPEGTDGFVGISFDITESKRAEERLRALTNDLKQQVSHLNALHKISDAMISSESLDYTLGVVLHQARQELFVDAASILMYDSDLQVLTYVASKGFRTNPATHAALPLGTGLAGKAALERKAIEVQDVRGPEAGFEPFQLILDEGFVSYACIPLISRGELQGTLSLFHRDQKDFPDSWRELARGIGHQAAIAIDDAHLFEDLQRSNAELQLSYERTIEGWARALDLKDVETAGHSKRVTELAVELALSLGVSGKDLAHLRRGALLHDIGKMGIPDNILLKPGKLDADEWEIMKRHTMYGRDFLVDIPFLEDAIDIPYCHHERWDGTGYPQGLQSEQIPFGARIFAVVDVFDALMSDRPYRKAWRRDEALAHIEAGAGAHFDPSVVKMFLGGLAI